MKLKKRRLWGVALALVGIAGLVPFTAVSATAAGLDALADHWRWLDRLRAAGQP